MVWPIIQKTPAEYTPVSGRFILRASCSPVNKMSPPRGISWMTGKPKARIVARPSRRTLALAVKLQGWGLGIDASRRKQESNPGAASLLGHRHFLHSREDIQN